MLGGPMARGAPIGGRLAGAEAGMIAEGVGARLGGRSVALIATVLIAACSGSDASGEAEGPAGGDICDSTRRHASTVQDHYRSFLDSPPSDAEINSLSDTLISLNELVADTDWTAMADATYAAVASLDTVPRGNAATSNFDRNRWAFKHLAGISAEWWDVCVEPERQQADDDARERREDFLDTNS